MIVGGQVSDITIVMPSYNRGEYIAEALDSVFMQETSYDYHVVIPDDCSTDDSLEIIGEYQKKYPDKITLITSEKNQKLYKNILRAYEIAKSDYFCVLDPDDLWLDKFKIQKALDFLENNKEYTIYIAGTDFLMPNGERKKFIRRNEIAEYDFKHYLQTQAYLGHTSGTIFRNVVFKNGVPDKMKNLECPSQEQSFRGDSFRMAIHLQEGKAYCAPEVESLYRITDDGIWQRSSKLEQELINANIFKDLWLYFGKSYPELIASSYKWFVKCKMLPDFLKMLMKEEKNFSLLVELESVLNDYSEEISKVNNG